MATNLNPGADATLVTAAARAGFADAPADYSKAFEKAAESYGRTMKASSEMWKNIAKLGAKIGAEAMKSAQEQIDMLALGAGLNPENTDLFVNGLQDIKDELKELGWASGRFGDRETKINRAKLIAKQKEFFAGIDNHVLDLKSGVEFVASGAFEVLPGNEIEGEMVNAIVKSNLKDPVTSEGNVAKLTRNEETGELMYTMYKEDGSLAPQPSGEPITMTMKEFKEAIANNTSDGGKMQKWSTTYNNGRYTNGTKSIDGVYDPQMKQMDLNQLDEVIKTDNDLKRMFKTKIGYSNTTFYDDIRNPSTLSGDLYNTLLTATGGGDVLTGDYTDNMVDTDGEAGISQAELQNTNNYNILSANILGLTDPEVSKAYFKEYASKNFQATFEYGYRKKPPTPGGGGGGGGGDNLPSTYKNRNVDIDMFLHEGDKGRSKFTTTSDTIIKWDEDLQAMEKTGEDSMSNEAYVNINGVKYGFVPGQGFREVEDISTSYGLSYKHDTRYFKTPEDIFKYHNIPLTYVGISTLELD